MIYHWGTWFQSPSKGQGPIMYQKNLFGMQKFMEIVYGFTAMAPYVQL